MLNRSSAISSCFAQRSFSGLCPRTNSTQLLQLDPMRHLSFHLGCKRKTLSGVLARKSRCKWWRWACRKSCLEALNLLRAKHRFQTQTGFVCREVCCLDTLASGCESLSWCRISASRVQCGEDFQSKTWFQLAMTNNAWRKPFDSRLQRAQYHKSDLAS